MAWTKSEAELARYIIEYLQDHKWEVFQEVIGPAGTADIVARFGNRIWVIECKQALNLTVMEQADRWKPFAHFVSIAVPWDGKVKSQFEFGRRVCETLGIGVLEARSPTGMSWHHTADGSVMPSGAVVQSVPPALHRRPLNGLITALRPQHKTYCAAGTSAGKRWTPFKETAANVQNYVWKHPGVDAKTLIKAIKHHYRTPVTATIQIVSLSEQGVIAGVRVERQGRTIRFYPQVAGLSEQAKPPAIPVVPSPTLGKAPSRSLVQPAAPASLERAHAKLTSSGRLTAPAVKPSPARG